MNNPVDINKILESAWKTGISFLQKLYVTDGQLLFYVEKYFCGR